VTIPEQGDLYYSNVSLLLRMDGVNGSTTFTDSGASPHTVTAVGNAAITTSQYKYGTGSGTFDGAGDCLTIPTSSAFDFASGDFTVELWVRRSGTQVYTGLVSLRASPFTGLQIGFGNGNNNLRIVWGDSEKITPTSSPLSDGVWTHVALVRSGNTVTLYQSGTSVGTQTLSVAMPFDNAGLAIGRLTANDTGYEFAGQIDDVRITKGVARYTAAFTPPTAAAGVGPYIAQQTLPVTVTGSGGGSGLTWSSVPASATATGTAGSIAYDGSNFYLATAANTWKRAALTTFSVTDSNFANVSLLMHFDGDLSDSSIAGRTATAYGDAATTGTAKFGSASLTLDGSGDYVSVPSSTDFDLGTSYTVECWIRPASGTWNGGILARGAYNSTSNTWAGLCFSMRRLGGDGFTRFYWYATNNSNEQYVDVSNSNFPVNTWTHLAMVRSGTTGTIYANGSSVGTISGLNTNAASSEDVSIGRWPQVVGNSEFFNGQIDEVRITRGVARTITAAPTAAFS
jgi:hypothetical protein